MLLESNYFDKFVQKNYITIDLKGKNEKKIETMYLFSKMQKVLCSYKIYNL